MTDEQMGEILFAGARLAPRPAIIPDPGLSVPLDAGEPGAPILGSGGLTALLQARAENNVPVTVGRNILLAGTSLVAGEGKALVYATGAHTEFGQIAHLAQTSRTTVSPLRKELARLSRLIAVLAVAIGVLFFAVAAAIP